MSNKGNSYNSTTSFKDREYPQQKQEYHNNKENENDDYDNNVFIHKKNNNKKKLTYLQEQAIIACDYGYD